MKAIKLPAAVLVIVVLSLALSGAALAQPPAPEIPGGTVMATGFNGPQGVLVDDGGGVWVIDSGVGGDEPLEVPAGGGQVMSAMMGQTASISLIASDGTVTSWAVLPSVFVPEMGEVFGGGRLALLDGVLYATSAAWSSDGSVGPISPLFAAIVRVDNTQVVPVADVWAFEASANPDGTILDTHPYGLTAGPDGWLWLADAGGNDLLRINPATGDIELVAVFDALPGVFPSETRDGAMLTDPVPTAVAFDAAGNVYVSLLSGGPFVPGSAKVMRVASDGTVSDYATGLTMLTDLTRGPDGAFYAVQFGQFTEEGPIPNAGSVVRIAEGDASEVLVSGLPFPTSIAFDSAGNAYVTINGVGAPGSGAVVRFDGLTGMTGMPVAAAQ